MSPEPVGAGTLIVPTRALTSGVLTEPFNGPLGFELRPIAGPTKRVVVPWSQPTMMRTRLVTSFSIPFLLEVRRTRESGISYVTMPTIQMEIYVNNVLVYISPLEAVSLRTIEIEQPANSGTWLSYTEASGVLSADLTNPVVLDSNSQLELGMRGMSPFLLEYTAEVLMITNMSPGPVKTFKTVLEQVVAAENANHSPPNGLGNFRYEEIDKYPSGGRPNPALL